ncbi:protein-glutamine glutaminase family protein [Streptomyces sp. CSDS2]|uniref:protein-glutamine glutaminase family protein n=1 Tax=Streptomyces sp. CSDS2 TaxID=3055051 RepID=UPI0025B19ED3|nr:protein-glutamine glutaminase family protein [Streptomyces sp. CSDS2]MDN3261248.1 protein-glutamine glutaminase family protein [Streptomyces sp. CSDS2]
MRRSAREEIPTQERDRAPRRAPDRAEGAGARADSLPSARPSGLWALQRSAGNAAVTAAIQRMEDTGGKRKRSASPEDQAAPKQARAAVSSEEEYSEEEEYSSSSEEEEPFSDDVVQQIEKEQQKVTVLLEQMDQGNASDTAKRSGQDHLELLTLLRNLIPMRSVDTVHEAIRLLGTKPDSKRKAKYLELLEEQLEYLADKFPEAGPPTAEALQAMWPDLVPAFGSAGGQVGEDGCEDRAHAICLAIARRSPAIAAHHLSKQWALPDGGRLHADHQWNHHVAASVTTADGILVIDPVFDRSRPLLLSEWANRVQVDPRTNVHQVAWGFLGRPGADNQPDVNSAVEYLP